MTLKELRNNKGLTQSKCAKFLNIPLRTYARYENNEDKLSNIKYQYIIENLNKYGLIDEEHGILSIDQIKVTCKEVFKNYDIEFCYLFGSYAKNKANEISDIDLLISTNLTGIKFFGLVEELREKLHKKIDLLNINQLNNNQDLLKEILKDGIKIYG